MKKRSVISLILLIINLFFPSYSTMGSRIEETEEKKYPIILQGTTANIMHSPITQIDDTYFGKNLDFVNQIGGSMMGITSSGSLVFVGVGPRMVILSLDDQKNPKIIGTTNTIPAVIEAIFVNGNYAYAVSRYGGLSIFDITDPTSPSDVSYLEIYGYNSDVKVNGDYVYVASQSQGLIIIDVSNPSFPKEIGSYKYADANEVKVVPPYAYITSQMMGLLILNISNPLLPVYVGSCPTQNPAWGIEISGKYAYVTELFSTLSVFDIDDPTGPKKISSYDNLMFPIDLVLVDSFAFIADGDQGLKIIDVSNPSQMRMIGSADTPACAREVTVVGDYAYIADSNGGLRVINAQILEQPYDLGFSINIPRSVQTITLTESLAFVNDSQKIFIYDISDPMNLKLVSEYKNKFGGYIYCVNVSGAYAYVCNMYSMQILDISDPSNIKLIGEMYFNGEYGCSDIEINNNYAYTSSYWPGMQIINVSDPYHPFIVGSIMTSNIAYNLSIVGNYAYIAEYENGLRIIDISNPTSPKPIGFYKTLSSPRDVAIEGKYAYVTEWLSEFRGFEILDISDPTNPVLVKSFPLLDYSAGIIAEYPYVYLANYQIGLLVFDMSNPDNPITIGTYNTADLALDVVKFGKYIFVADNDGGFYRLLFEPPTTNDIDLYIKGQPLIGVQPSGITRVPIKFGNDGASTATSVSISAELGIGLTYIGDSTGTTRIIQGNTITWSFPDIEFGIDDQFDLLVSVPYTPLGSKYPVELEIQSDGIESFPNNNTFVSEIMVAALNYLPIIRH